MLITPNLKGMADGLNRIQPSLGVLLLAASLRARGHAVEVFDTALAGWHNRRPLDELTVTIGASDDEIADRIGAYDPDIVGISALFSNLVDSAHAIAGVAKRVKPEATVVLGGNHIANAVGDYQHAVSDPASGLPAQLPDLDDANIDYAIWGEADEAFPALVDGLVDGAEVSGVAGLVTRQAGGGYRVNPRATYRGSLSALPHPARDLVDMERYFEIGAFHSPKSRSRRVVNVMASRGCPEHCTFCTTPVMWGSQVRWRDVDDIAAEIRTAKARFDVGEIQFEDDTLTANRGNLLRLCAELEKIGLPWCTPNGTKVNYHLRTQSEMYRAMADAGCYQITLACESGVQRVLDEVLRKNLQRDAIPEAIARAKAAGMLVHTFWILGAPGETYDDMMATVDFALASGADSFSFSILSPLPGTPVYRKVVRENLWWPGRGIRDLLFRSSLIKVDGFRGPDEFERFVAETNVRANRLLQTRDPERFRAKYGTDVTERELAKQT
jgi:anaerobic magnesium-protoporphyrin IX monomethyl ester cyclase